MGIVTISTFKVPLGEDRVRVMEFVEPVLAPQEKADPHVRGLHQPHGSLTLRMHQGMVPVEMPGVTTRD